MDGFIRPDYNDLDRLERIVFDVFEIHPKYYLKGSRKKKYVRARQALFYLCRIVDGMMFTEISEKYKKHHTTIMYAIWTVQDNLRIYPNDDYTHKIDKCLKLCNLTR